MVRCSCGLTGGDAGAQTLGFGMSAVLALPWIAGPDSFAEEISGRSETVRGGREG